MKKFGLALLAALVFYSGTAGGKADAAANINYIALGDSLAAGQTPNSEIDFGYSDLISQELWRNGRLAFFSKDLAFPGFTTEDVLERVKSDEAREVIQQANLITVSAGANDLLRLVQSNPETGSLIFQQRQVDFSLNKARANMEKILAELQAEAPRADIYVMGYYFAYPHARESQKPGTAKQLDRLNDILRLTAENAGVKFISVDASFGQDAVGKLPNPADVHPNLVGYQAMANAFLTKYDGTMNVDKFELPEAAPISFEEILASQEEEANAIDGSVQRPSEGMDSSNWSLKEARPLI
ncbi:MAG TPA: SGNH/GDSL hydrolase family protein [Planococcus sp. (in: firmicutes)]|nr:SGNH/GDSL hydrolase family protein [Planococcus sp. (in: firmicutes)]